MRVPLDAENIINLGVENWRYFLPKSADEEQGVFEGVLGEFVRVFRGCGSTERDLIKINYKLIYEFANVINASDSLGRLRDMGGNPTYRPDRVYYNVLSPNYEYKPITLTPPPKNFRIASYKYNLLSKKHYLNVDRISHLKEKYIRENKIRIFSRGSLLKRVPLAPTDVGLVENLTYNLVRNLPIKNDFFAIRTKNILSETLMFYRGGLAWEGGILFITFGNVFPRIMATLANKGGLETVGTAHGNRLGHHAHTPTLYFNDLSFTKKYLVDDERSKRNMESLRGKYDYFGKSDSDIISCDCPPPKHRTKHKKAIMAIDIPITYQRYYYYPVINFFTHLYLFRKVFKILRGHSIIYKAHPNNNREIIEKLYGDLVDDIIWSPFENVYNLADTYIFSVFATTTFGFAFNTGAKMICFDNMELADKGFLEKRVHFIKTVFHKDEIEFDENELLNTVRNYDRLDYPGKVDVHPSPPEDTYGDWGLFYAGASD